MAAHQRSCPHNQPAGPFRPRRQLTVAFLLLCALAAVASAQILERTIMLPDSFGPMVGSHCLAWDDNPDRARLFIGSDSGDVFVVDANTYKKLARITGVDAKGLCFVAPHNRLYVARATRDSVAVVDCSTNTVTKSIRIHSRQGSLLYNPLTDRLYCGGSPAVAIDCAADTVIRTIGTVGGFALDSVQNKIYGVYNTALVVIDGLSDSVVGTVGPFPGVVRPPIFNPTAGKVYAVAGDTLFSVDAGGDTVVARLPFAGLTPALACDPVRNRVYCAFGTNWAGVDCATDTLLFAVGGRTASMALDVARERLYRFPGSGWSVYVHDASTGGQVASFLLEGKSCPAGLSGVLDRLYCLPMSDVTGVTQFTAVDCSDRSIAGIVPLVASASRLCVDSLDNKLYFVNPGDGGGGSLGVVDCARRIVTSYVLPGQYVRALCYNPNNNRLYCGTYSTDGNGYVTVLDCSADTVLKRIWVPSSVVALQLHPALNKLYALTVPDIGNIAVIDCGNDSLEKLIIVQEEHFGEFVMVAEDDRLWCLGAYHVTAIDCIRDSIMADVQGGLGSFMDVCVSIDDRRLYVTGGLRALAVIDMDSPSHIDSLPSPGGNLLCYVPRLHKVYWCENRGGPPYSSRVRIIDSRTDSITGEFCMPGNYSGISLGDAGRYVYCVGKDSGEVLAAVDARADSVVAVLDLPPGSTGTPTLNTSTGRFYVAQAGLTNGIPVIHDSSSIGVGELKPRSGTPGPRMTSVNHGGLLAADANWELRDATGRQVADLRAGWNDLGRLTSGVYFLRESPCGKARKIVVVK